MITKLIIIQPTSLCNLNCSYCYIPGRKNKKIMTDDTLESCAKVIMNSKVTIPESENDKVIISWHAGEPLLAGIDFYRKAIETFDRFNLQKIPYVMNIQTNATLINQSWCDFLIEQKFTLGVSIDGPEFLHNLHRKNWSNKGSFKKVMDGIRLLQDNNIPIGAICVLTSNSLEYPDEMYEFFKTNGFNDIGFNIDEQEGTHLNSSYHCEDNNVNHDIVKKYANFLERFFQLWYLDARPFRVREFDDFLGRLNFYRQNNYGSHVVATETIAFANIGITVDGDIVTFSPELATGTSNNRKEFVIGNINEIDAFEDLTKSDKFQSQLEANLLGIKNCANECEYFDFCGGGSAANKIYEKGSFSATETTYCLLTRKTTIDVITKCLSNAELV